MPTIIVTGVNGFVGHHLVTELVRRKCKVIGVGREESPSDELKTLLETYYFCDLTNAEEVNKLPFDTADGLINLAGLAAVGASFGQADLYNKVNVGVLETVCEAVKKLGSALRIIAISTGGVYDAAGTPPFSEDSKLVDSAQASPYVASKLQMEAVAQSYANDGVNCIVVRPFNHLGPGQAAGFLLPDLAAGIKQSLAAGQPLRVGNLSTKRDYTDVRDVVSAYCDLVLTKETHHATYNVASGTPISGSRILELLMNNLSTNQELTLETDPSLVRPGDPEVLSGDSSRLQRDIGWKPSIPIEKTVADFTSWFNDQR